MRVAVTGGGGFIGTAVMVELGARGHDAVSIDRSSGERVELRSGMSAEPIAVRHPYGIDVLSYKALVGALRGCDAVIHLAGILGTAELFERPGDAIDVNIRGTLNVLEACLVHNLRYVGITMPDAFPSIYAATKLAATRLARAYHHAHGIPVSHVRAFNAYGEGQKHGPGHPRKIIPAFATEAWAGDPLIVWGDGYQTVDLIHVSDLARLLVDALDHGDDVTIDGGTGMGHTVNAIAAWVIDLAGSPSMIEYRPMRKGELPTEIVAQGEGWDRLDWRPRFHPTLLAETVESYRP